MPYHQNSAGHGGRRCETARKTEVKIHGHHQEGHQKECADGRQHSRPQELEIGSAVGAGQAMTERARTAAGKVVRDRIITNCF